MTITHVCVTIIKNNLNYVFGGYTSAAWDSTSGWINDLNAFIFSLRRNGNSTNEKFMVKKPRCAIYGHASMVQHSVVLQ